MRTPFGSLYTQLLLPDRLLRWGGKGYYLPADPNARFGFGGDLRVGLYANGSDDYEDSLTFENPNANLYGEFRIVPERLSVYLDQRLGSGASSSRELFALLTFRGGDGYVKLGRILPPYGWALPDDSAFIREPLGFAFTASDLGVEVGFEPGKWSTQLAVINGSGGSTDIDRGKKATLLTMRRLRKAVIGLSAAYDAAKTTRSTWGGVLGGLQLGRFSFLAEADWRHVSPDQGPSEGARALYFETDFLIRRGMTVKYYHDWKDPRREEPTDQQQRDTLAFEYVPYPFVQLRALVRRSDGPPQVAGSRDRQAELEVHVFF
jgi:hypothetical protein